MIKIKYPCGLEITIKNSFWDYLGGNALNQQIPDTHLKCPIHGKKCSELNNKTKVKGK